MAAWCPPKPPALELALAQEGVTAVYGGGLCTYSNAPLFYSHRREAPTGRQAALIWRNA